MTVRFCMGVKSSVKACKYNGPAVAIGDDGPLYLQIPMKVHFSLDNLPEIPKAVITIGSFDGLHRGHQQLLERIVKLADHHGGESMLITFDPHPRHVLQPDSDEPKLLTTIAEKVELISRLGIDHILVVPFTETFSQQSAEAYIRDFLVEHIKPFKIVIGYDHHFGRDRQGNIELLRHLGPVYNYEVIEIEAQEVDDIAVSSTKIREALLSGNLERSRDMLGYDYILTGRVVKGRQIGREIGYPTANLDLGNKYKLVPADGIYATRVSRGTERYEGMLYIGNRPSIDEGLKRTIELNIFEFEGNLYGEELSVELVSYLRSDKQLPTLDALKAQLAEDEKSARRALEDRLEEQEDEVMRNLSTAIVILNYNGLDFLQKFLPAVVQNTAPNTRVVVADNASTDGSVAWLRTAYPDMKLIVIPKNLGFAGGYNEALKQVEADIFVLLNSDVEVTPGWLEPCLALFEDSRVAAVQPKILSQSNPAEFEYAGASGGLIDTLGYPFCRGRVFYSLEKDSGQYDGRQEVFWASGAALFIRSKLFHGIGGFEEEYFAHFEEIDLCWRLKRAGYRIMAEPRSVVHHVGGGTLSYNSPKKAYLNFRNTLVTSLKNESIGKLIWWLPIRLLLDGLAGVLFLYERNLPNIGSIVKAHWHVFPKMSFWWKRRRLRNKQIENMRIGPDRSDIGRLYDSIILHYYMLKNKRYSEINRPQISARKES
ncbi:MAG: bifunctional riboflavin kinase/FAD synthetase [Bacteroidota bacterium]